jgi:hypothetical protein
MATGSGKTTVMAMLAAWSILNKVNDRSDGRFSDLVLAVCPNVTIRNRLRELDPENGEASIYRTRDLVPSHLMPHLSQGGVLVTNWHRFEPQAPQAGGESARVNRSGVAVRTQETITIAAKTTTARGGRYLTLDAYQRQVAAGMHTVLGEERDKDGTSRKSVSSRFATWRATPRWCIACSAARSAASKTFSCSTTKLLPLRRTRPLPRRPARRTSNSRTALGRGSDPITWVARGGNLDCG